jgi:hypothetical protein
MAKITKLVLKNETSQPRIYRNDKYRISALTSDNLISTSLSNIDTGIIQTNNLDTFISAGIGINNTLMSLTQRDYASELQTINNQRNPGSNSNKDEILYSPMVQDEDLQNYLEKIPDNIHISEYLRNLKNINQINEYSLKQSFLIQMNKIYGSNETPYTTNLWMLPLGLDDEEISFPDNKKLESTNIKISGYIKLTNTVENSNLYLIMRGVPIPMRRVLTSVNYIESNISSYNYIFLYPQYLINNIELIQAIDYIEISNSVLNTARIYYGKDNYFETIDNIGYDQYLAPLHILNREFRNLINGQEEPDPQQ